MIEKEDDHFKMRKTMVSINNILSYKKNNIMKNKLRNKPPSHIPTTTNAQIGI